MLVLELTSKERSQHREVHQAQVVVDAQSCPTLHDPCTVAHEAPSSMGFSRQEY